jgi:hypothetical protein
MELLLFFNPHRINRFFRIVFQNDCMRRKDTELAGTLLNSFPYRYVGFAVFTGHEVP